MHLIPVLSRLRLVAPLAFLAIASGKATLAQAAAPTATEARAAFRFLLGRWEVLSHEDSTGRRASQGETYAFDSVAAGGAIGGRWHFNRGTSTAPDFADAVYYSGFDTRSARWSFYYISPQSAQAWPGEYGDGRWNFRQTFQDSRGSFEQRQWWEPVGDTLLRRHIENSRDGGRKWSSYVITLRRIPTRP